MLGPGEYVPDPTEGITAVEDLPQPRLERRSRNYPARRCPRCGHRAGRPIDLVVTDSKHHCPHCDCYFAIDLSDLAWPKCHYTRRVQELAVRLVAEDGLPYQAASWHLWRDHRVFVPAGTVQNWVEAAGEKKAGQPDDDLPRRGAEQLQRLSGHRRALRGPALHPQRGGQPPVQPPGLPCPGP